MKARGGFCPLSTFAVKQRTSRAYLNTWQCCVGKGVELWSENPVKKNNVTPMTVSCVFKLESKPNGVTVGIEVLPSVRLLQ